MNDFDEVAYEAFLEAAKDKYDFGTCQRPDGSYYGTSGTCRKGTPVNGKAPSKKEKKMASMRAKDLKKRGASGENHGKQVKGSGGGGKQETQREKNIRIANEEEARLKKLYGRGNGKGNPMDRLTSEDVMRVAGTQD